MNKRKQLIITAVLSISLVIKAINPLIFLFPVFAAGNAGAIWTTLDS
jgi:hypothetical protein